MMFGLVHVGLSCLNKNSEIDLRLGPFFGMICGRESLGAEGRWIAQIECLENITQISDLSDLFTERNNLDVFSLEERQGGNTFNSSRGKLEKKTHATWN